LNLSTNPSLHLAVVLDQAGSHPAAATEPDGPGDHGLHARYWIDCFTLAQRGGLDLVTIEDSQGLVPAAAEAAPPGHGRLDAVTIACRVAPATRHVGIVPMASTSLTEPFLVSSQIATLDYVSGGRAGWEVDVTTAPGAAAYFGPRHVPTGEALFAEAAEHVDAVRRLWDSWDDGAEIRDTATQRFIDRDRVHHIDFEGQGFRIRGPSITPRPPQGQPIVATLVDSDRGQALAASSADVAFLAATDEAALRRRADAVRCAAAAAGRDPAQMRLLADVDVVLHPDPGAATERRARLDARTPRVTGRDRLGFTGSAAQLADRLLEWSALGIDGFRFRPAAVLVDLPQIAGPCVEAFRARGARRDANQETTLRGRLGLPRPASRYAIA
jgi:alkanesulfonate monooxygenase SsuD/methylene tetrahydromethanopterin reductase-like flavin-dependent oxidoreductase (luciferase family)